MKNPFLDIFKKSTHAPLGAHVRPDASGQSQRTAESLLDESLINDTVRDWMNNVTSDEAKLDRVLSKAMEEGLITVDDVVAWSKVGQIKDAISRTGTVSWRDVVEIDPWRSLQMERIAARVYGFRSILICQMSTLVLADMMVPIVSPKIWDQMFEMNLAPVVKHGQPPMLNGRILCVSKDPTSRKTRNYVNGITQFTAELAYADAPVVKGMLELIAQHVPAIGAAVYTTRPKLQKVPSIPVSNKRAA